MLLGGGGLYPSGIHYMGRRNQHLANARDLVRSAENCSLCALFKNIILASVESFPEGLNEIKMEEWLLPEPLVIKPECEPPFGLHPEGEYLTELALEVPVAKSGPSINVLRLKAELSALESQYATVHVEYVDIRTPY
jgi:hypothetical protein